MRLQPISLKWKSKATLPVSHVARHGHRIGCTRHWRGDEKPVFGRAFDWDAVSISKTRHWGIEPMNLKICIALSLLVIAQKVCADEQFSALKVGSEVFNNVT